MWILAFGLCACLAASCTLPLSHTCQTSDDCILGECLEGVCRERRTGDASPLEASTADGRDAIDARYDGSADRAMDGLADNVAMTATETGDAGSSPDQATDGPGEDADAATDDADAGTDSGLPVHEACGPAWPEWPMPAPTTLTGVPDDPERSLPNPASYDTTSPDVVVDNVTHLVWQRVVSTDARTYAQAASYCAALDLDGRKDWRLPSRIELVSLIDWDRARLGSIDPAFPDHPLQTMWACTSGPSNPLIAWSVDFNNGSLDITKKTSSLLARCVSGSRSSTPPPARYEIEADGTVTDVKTPLTWQATLAPTDLSWGDGYDYCQWLGPGWRLPTVREIETLVDETQVHSAVDPAAFPDRPEGSYWTSSGFNSDFTLQWSVALGFGNTGWNATSDLKGVRCVR
jgi:hypothetical protein